MPPKSRSASKGSRPMLAPDFPGAVEGGSGTPRGVSFAPEVEVGLLDAGDDGPGGNAPNDVAEGDEEESLLLQEYIRGRMGGHTFLTRAQKHHMQESGKAVSTTLHRHITRELQKRGAATPQPRLQVTRVDTAGTDDSSGLIHTPSSAHEAANNMTVRVSRKSSEQAQRGSIKALVASTRGHSQAAIAAARARSQYANSRTTTAGGFDAHARAQCVVDGVHFTFAVVFVVLAHTLFLAFDTDMELDRVPETGTQSITFAVDLTCTIFYTSEAALRAFAYRSQYPTNPWNLLDLALIAVAMFDLETIATESGSKLGVTPGLRTLRLLRLARLIRLFRFSRSLWLLVVGVLASMRTVVWAWFLVGIIIYVFALFFTRIFEPHVCSATGDPDLKEYFGSFPRALLTTFQVTTLEDWPKVTETGVRAESWVGIVFVLLLLLSTWGVMQAIIAVFVNNALEASTVRSKDLARKAKEDQMMACRQLCEVFRVADLDGNGVLSKAEFQSVMHTPDFIRRLMAVGIDPHGAESLFDILDLDGSQSLDGYEFVEGALRMCGKAQNKELLGLRCDVWRVSLEVEDDLNRAREFIRCRFQQTMDRIEALRLAAAPLLRLAAESLASNSFGDNGLGGGSISSNVSRRFSGRLALGANQVRSTLNDGSEEPSSSRVTPTSGSRPGLGPEPPTSGRRHLPEVERPSFDGGRPRTPSGSPFHLARGHTHAFGGAPHGGDGGGQAASDGLEGRPLSARSDRPDSGCHAVEGLERRPFRSATAGSSPAAEVTTVSFVRASNSTRSRGHAPP